MAPQSEKAEALFALARFRDETTRAFDLSNRLITKNRNTPTRLQREQDENRRAEDKRGRKELKKTDRDESASDPPKAPVGSWTSSGRESAFCRPVLSEPRWLPPNE